MVSTELADLSIDDENQTMEIQDDTRPDEDLLPGKQTRNPMASTDKDKPKDHTVPSLKTTGSTDPTGKMRAKAADYDIGTRSVIQTAIGIYCANLLCNDPYPPPVKEIEWAKAAWEKACGHHQVNILHDAVILKLVNISLSYMMVPLWQS